MWMPTTARSRRHHRGRLPASRWADELQRWRRCSTRSDSASSERSARRCGWIQTTLSGRPQDRRPTSMCHAARPTHCFPPASSSSSGSRSRSWLTSTTRFLAASTRGMCGTTNSACSSNCYLNARIGGPENELLDRLCHAGLVLMAGDVPAATLQVADRIPHDDGPAREFQHLEIVEVVTDGHHLVGREAHLLGPPCQRVPFR